MNNRIVAYVLAVIFIVFGLWMTKKAIGKKKWAAKRVMLCFAGVGGFAAGGYCVFAARKF